MLSWVIFTLHVISSVSVAVLPRSSMSQPKAAVIRHLQNMSDQLKVIDEMSQNIERDFQSSNLVNLTLTHIFQL